MNRELAILLLVTAVAAAVAAALTLTDRGPGAPAGAGERLFPELGPNEARVAAIEVSEGGRTLRLERAGETWTLPACDGYPVEDGRAAGLFRALVRMQRVEPSTRNPALYERVGLTDPDADPDSGAIRVRVLDGAGVALAEVLAGDRAPGTVEEAQFVRAPDDPQAWAATGTIAVSADPQSWLDPSLLRVGYDRVASARLERFDGGGDLEVYRERPQDIDFTPRAIPPGRIAVPSAGARFARVPGSLRFEAVRRAASLLAELEPVARATYSTFDGARLTLQVFERAAEDAVGVEGVEGDEDDEDDEDGGDGEPAAPERWITLEAAVDEAAGLEGDALDAREDEVAAWNARFAGWAFRVGTWQGESLLLDREALFEDPPSAPAPETLPPSDEAVGPPPPDTDG